MAQPIEAPNKNSAASLTIHLAGRYWAFMSVFPLFLFGFVLFFAAAFFAVSLVMGEPLDAFDIILAPFATAALCLGLLLGTTLWILRWHGRRSLEILETGMLYTQGKREPVFVRWTDLNAVELRYAKPNIIHCTLKTPFWEFSFSNLDLNLVRRVPFSQVFEEGFRVDRVRQFLFLLKKMAPQLEWRLGTSFQSRYQIFYPPYDLERLV